jgi:hypothetical protein
MLYFLANHLVTDKKHRLGVFSAARIDVEDWKILLFDVHVPDRAVSPPEKLYFVFENLVLRCLPQQFGMVLPYHSELCIDVHAPPEELYFVFKNLVLWDVYPNDSEWYDTTVSTNEPSSRISSSGTSTLFPSSWISRERC